MSEQAEFRILIEGAGCNVEEWQRALGAPNADLHLESLTPDQKEVAKRFGVSTEDYARGLLAHQYGRQRRESEARALGQHVVELLGGLGEGYALSAVIWESDRLRWMLRIETPGRVVGVPVPFELAEDVVDSGVLSEIENLRRILLDGVGRRDLAV